MIRLPDLTIACLQAAGEPYLHFMEGWAERLHHGTIDMYRTRDLNLRLALEELQATIHDFHQRAGDNVNVTLCCEEVLELLKQDPVVDSIVSRKQFVLPILSAAAASKKLDDLKQNLAALEIVVQQLLLALVPGYRSKLVKALMKALESSELRSVRHLSSALLTDLLGSGYDRRWLFRSVQNILWRLRDGSTSPDQARHWILQYIEGFHQDQPKSFQVKLRLNFLKPEHARGFPTQAPGFEIQPYDTAERIFLMGRVEGLDAFSAANKALSRCLRILAMVSLCQPGSSPTVHRTIEVIAPEAVSDIPTQVELLGPLRLQKLDPDLELKRLTFLMDHPAISQSTKERLQISLRSFQNGLASRTPNEQFLALWIGLETLLTGGTRSGIAYIRDRLPTLLALAVPRNCFRDLLENLKRLNALGFMTDGELTVFEQSARPERLAQIWDFLLNDSRQSSILEHLRQRSSLLAYRWETIRAAFLTSKSTLQRLEVTVVNSSRHLQRLYRVRNALVHGGATPSDLTGVSNHLLFYFWHTWNQVTTALHKAPHLRTIEGALDKHTATHQLLVGQLKACTPPAVPVELRLDLLSPGSCWPTQI